MSNSNYYWIFSLLVLWGLGCSGTASVSLTDTSTSDEPSDSVINWAEFEDFDLEFYQEPPGDLTVEILHDVPALLLGSDASSIQMTGLRSGFRIQIISTLNKQEADQTFEDALTWWRDFEKNASTGQLYPQREPQPPVYQDFRAPHYRVRIGNFLSREDAERLLEIIEDFYASAFIAPDLVRLE